MKERIYTVPLNEAFDADTECAFCQLHKKLNDDALKYTLGASYMEEDVRETTDKIGFCKTHYKEMYDIQNRLGLSLIVSTHLKKINAELEKVLKSDLKSVDSEKKSGLFKKSDEKMTKTKKLISDIQGGCFICEKIQHSMDRYVDTFFFLWKTEPDFKAKVVKSKGFCLEHFGILLENAGKMLNSKDYAEFVTVMAPIVQENLKRVEEELLWFIDKFDYRFEDRPWKNSKTSLPRSIIKVSGKVVDKINYEENEE